MKATLFDYGAGNLHSLGKALEHAGATVVVERPSGVGPAPASDAWKATWERAYGDTLVTVLTTSMG